MDGVKCEHPQCTCYVGLGEMYCSVRCRIGDATDGDAAPHGHCPCNHEECEGAETP
jgi:hypothetical protein